MTTSKNIFEVQDLESNAPTGAIGAVLGVAAGVLVTSLSERSNALTIIGTAVVGSAIGTSVTAVTNIATSFTNNDELESEIFSGGVTAVGTAGAGALFNLILGSSN